MENEPSAWVRALKIIKEIVLLMSPLFAYLAYDQSRDNGKKADVQSVQSNEAREVIEKKVDKVEATLYVPPDKRGPAPEAKK